MLTSGHSVSAHEFTPTYPVLKQSYVQGVLYTTMSLFNLRQDVEYYEVEVFDNDWNKVPFAIKNKIIKTDYLQKKKIEVYIRERDKDKAVYVCSKSKLILEGGGKTAVESRICSKFK